MIDSLIVILTLLVNSSLEGLLTVFTYLSSLWVLLALYLIISSHVEYIYVICIILLFTLGCFALYKTNYKTFCLFYNLKSLAVTFREKKARDYMKKLNISNIDSCQDCHKWYVSFHDDFLAFLYPETIDFSKSVRRKRIIFYEDLLRRRQFCKGYVYNNYCLTLYNGKKKSINLAKSDEFYKWVSNNGGRIITS